MNRQGGFVPAVIFEGMILLTLVGVILALAIPRWVRYVETREAAAFIAGKAAPGFGKINPQPILVTLTGLHRTLEGETVRLIPTPGPDGPAWRCRADAAAGAGWPTRLPRACRPPREESPLLTSKEILAWRD